MELYSSAFRNHPTPPRSADWGSRPQGPVGQVSRGLGARAPRAWGPARQGPGAFSPQKPPKPLKLRFFRKPPGGSLAKAWVSAETAASKVGTWRETKPGYPPYPPPPAPPFPLAFWGCKGERKRVFTLSAFGNHPTRPPRSADPKPQTLNPKPFNLKPTLLEELPRPTTSAMVDAWLEARSSTQQGREFIVPLK